jgi:biotin carboxyl carrier protein
VAAGDTLLILEAMKMETRIRAEGAGTVQRLLVEEGQMVDGGAVLIELEATD